MAHRAPAAASGRRTWFKTTWAPHYAMAVAAIFYMVLLYTAGANPTINQTFGLITGAWTTYTFSQAIKKGDSSDS